MTSTPISLAGLSDDQLLTELERLASAERRATAALVRCLAEVDLRRLYLGAGCASLFSYCTQVLHLAEGAAYNRIESARAARRFPAIFEALEDGSITLTAVRLLAPHLTSDNHRGVLTAARHRSKREIESLIASLRPQPAVPATIRKLPARRRAASEPDSKDSLLEASNSLASVVALPPPPPRPAIAPLAPERYKVQLTISLETYDKLRRAQDLLRHVLPTGDPAAIFDRALTTLVKELERRRYAETARPRPATAGSAGSRHIPAAVRREVWNRERGRCGFVGTNGRCTERAFLEFHHVEPYAVGGAATAANVELRCRSHNA